MLDDTLTGAPFNFENTVADPDVLCHCAKHPNGTKYYKLLLVYIDDILLISHDPKLTLEALGTVYTLKDGSLAKPDIYLGAQLYEHKLPDGRKAWTMASDKYVGNAVSTIKGLLQADGDGLHLKMMANVETTVTSRSSEPQGLRRFTLRSTGRENKGESSQI